MVSAEHGSEFWNRDKGQLAIRVKSILDSLDPNEMPTVSEVSYSNPDLVVPDFVFDEIAERIKMKENPPRNSPARRLERYQVFFFTTIIFQEAFRMQTKSDC